MKLNVYNNRTPLNLTVDEKKRVLKILMDAVGSLSFFVQRIKDGADMNDIHIHMSLLEYTVHDLAPLVHYDSILAEETERRHVEIRELNQRVQDLERQRGKEFTAKDIACAIREYENAFEAWYGAYGFRYASIKYGLYGIRANFSCELEHSPSSSLTTNKELFSWLTDKVQFITEDKNWDIIYDHYHSELADTQKNKENILNLFRQTFSSSVVNSFQARKNDFNSFSIEFDVFVPYEDV